jgi:hypothetical protein
MLHWPVRLIAVEFMELAAGVLFSHSLRQLGGDIVGQSDAASLLIGTTLRAIFGELPLPHRLGVRHRSSAAQSFARPGWR